MSVKKEEVMELLKGVIDPELNKDIVSLNMVESVNFDGQKINVKLRLTTLACPLKDELSRRVKDKLKEFENKGFEINVSFSDKTVYYIPDTEGIKNIVLVGSGKGGVGKSTVCANLAISLANSGAKVGILDADFYGPSMTVLFGLKYEQLRADPATQKIIPVEKFGIKILSLGMMLRDSDAVIWRGPLLHKTVEQFLKDVMWGELDYLLIDLPPGTGDIQLSLSQLTKVTGAVVVTTPQNVAFADVLRSVKMFEKINIPVVGLIENMSYYVCPDTGKKHFIFGEGRIQKYCEEYKIRYLGNIPINSDITISGDMGFPIVAQKKDEEINKIYGELARKIAGFISVIKLKPSKPDLNFTIGK